jgi:hypothetical protein
MERKRGLKLKKGLVAMATKSGVGMANTVQGPVPNNLLSELDEDEAAAFIISDRAVKASSEWMNTYMHSTSFKSNHPVHMITVL